ncbi:MAG: PH domain-containing protein [Saprospiraceae bacterium]|nr:PH domain-containing protein [Saprospiraceae bacterium]
MAYIENHLIRDEQIEHWAELHWIIFISFRSLLTLFIAPIIQRWASEFTITSKRIVNKTGLFKRSTFEMNLNKIESVQVEQSILGRILGYGNIIITGTGGTKEEFQDIAKPITFRKKFQELSS